LHLFVQGGAAIVRGTFAVYSPAGKILDRYRILIELPNNYPKDLPIVREVGDRIPWHQDFHVETNGVACVLLPDDRWRCFPVGAPFREYLDRPLHHFFLGQSLVALGEKWPFDEWKHGAEGIIQYYEELLDSQDLKTIVRYLRIIAKQNFKPHLLCPCGSGKKIKKCCHAKVVQLRRRIAPAVARKSLDHLGRPMPQTDSEPRSTAS